MGLARERDLLICQSNFKTTAVSPSQMLKRSKGALKYDNVVLELEDIWYLLNKWHTE